MSTRSKQGTLLKAAGVAMLGEGTEDGLMMGWMSDWSQFQTTDWCGGVMSTRRKHRALNGITQGDVNLGRAGGELNMITGLQ